MKIWVLTGKSPYSYGDSKKLIHGFESEAEARRIVDIIEECEPKLALDLVEIEVDRSEKGSEVISQHRELNWNFPVGMVLTGSELAPVVSGSAPSDTPQSPAANLAQPMGTTGPVTYEEPMPHMENFR